MMKKIVLFLLVALCVVSCDRVREEVILTYPNGKPELVYLVKGKDDKKVRVGEKMYYSNGQLRAEKHFKGAKETPTGTWEYYYYNGNMFAQGNFEKNHTFGADWKFYKLEKGDFFNLKFDSVKVVEISEHQIPGTVYYYMSDSIRVFQFYEDYNTRSTGMMRDGALDGRWQYFYPNGKVQLEALYIHGKENGVYCSYRENGIPYFRGIYINGVRAGIWEFYDMEGNLCGTKNYDKK